MKVRVALQSSAPVSISIPSINNSKKPSSLERCYRRLHSTATEMDSDKAVAFTLLDLSAAFDNIDHNTHFNCLSDWFGMDGTVLMWIKSYPTNCRHKVKLGNDFLDAFSLTLWCPSRFFPGSFSYLHFLPQLYIFQFQCYSSSVCR